jgi:signal transduction histidine kinase
MAKGTILIISSKDRFDNLSSYLEYCTDYKIMHSDNCKNAVSIIKSPNTPKVVLLIFERTLLNKDEKSLLEKGSFQKIAIVNSVDEYNSIKDTITLNRVFFNDIVKEDFILTVDENIRQYNLVNIAKKQKKELSEIKDSHDKMQKLLTDSEKLITLGKQLAGVIHEINTPFGAIKSSSHNMQISLTDVLESLPKLFELIDDEASKILFFKLLEQSAKETRTLTTREERKLKKELMEVLDSIGVEDSRDIATKFTKIKIYSDINEYIPLIKSEHSDFIFETAYHLTDLTSSNENITIAIAKVSKMIKAIKSFARYGHTEEMLQANIQESVETVLSIYHNQIKQGTELVREYDSDISDIYCYPDELNQVWTNLIHNALQAMDFKGTLTVGIKQDSDYQIVSIKDSGSGIPDEIKDKIFDAFFTTKPAGVGTGLGLDILKKIVDKHNGKIELDTKVGVGTEFKIFIPKKLEK